ncbi:MAG: bifunctional phosphopantothenoylcysteine decarboxylase/phosphopantothenate--cysteine ligase CoaBC [Mycobacteriales bacterium]
MNVVLGVSGGIAAYKAVEVLRLLVAVGHSVRVVPTQSALRFVGEPTWQALSQHPVATDVFGDAHDVAHVELGREVDLVIVAPATAHTIARAAHGLADDLLTNVLLTAQCPVLVAPAMHTQMWQHPATVANVAMLRQRGVLFCGPDTGALAAGDTGVGRLSDPTEIAWQAARILGRRAVGASCEADLSGRRVLVSAGGTREPLDPVRFLGNRSSGRQGYALARTAAARGAAVTLVAANVTLPAPAGVNMVSVTTTEQLRQAMLVELLTTTSAGPTETSAPDVVAMAAAPADFAPVTQAEHKLKKPSDGSAPTVRLRQTPDILAELVLKRSAGQLIVGFAAETGDAAADPLTHAAAKLAAKGCDLLVVNDVSAGRAFDVAENAVTILDPSGIVSELSLSSKDAVADAIWDVVAARLLV